MDSVTLHSPPLHNRVRHELLLFSPTLCNPMDCSMPGFPVHHQLPEFTQTHVHRVGDVIQPSHPVPLLLLPSIFPSIRVFSNESALHIRWPKYWSFSFSNSPSNEYLSFSNSPSNVYLRLIPTRECQESSLFHTFVSYTD